MVRRWVAVCSAVILTGLLALALGGEAAQAKEVTINMGDNFFEPATATVSVGDTVTWVHTGNRPHDVTADNGSFSSPRRMANGQKFSYTVTTAGTFTYLCTIHAQVQKGTLVVQAAAAAPVAAPAGAAPALPRSGGGGMSEIVSAGAGALSAFGTLVLGGLAALRRRRG